MSLPPQPANNNYAALSYAPWATWPTAGFRAWSALTAASLDSMFSVQRAWLEAGQELLRQQAAAVPQDGGAAETPVMLAAAMGDLRDCRSVVMQAQAEILESWRRSA